MIRQLTAHCLCTILLVGCSQAVSSFTPQPQPLPPSLRPATPVSSRTHAATASPAATATAAATPLAYPEPPIKALISELPATCPQAGHQAYQEDTPAEIAQLKNLSFPIKLERQQTLMVKNASDEVNGDTSSPEAIAAAPGKDGISLREALLAANTTSDGVSIRFEASLKDATINVGSWDQSELPALSGGRVTVNGDVNSDGVADITLNNALPTGPNRAVFGLRVHASDSVLYALKMTNFTNSILLDAPAKNQTYSDIVITHMAFEGDNGIGMGGGPGDGAQPVVETHNTWKNTWITENTFHSRGGISIGLTRSSHDRIDHLVIKDNLIEIVSDDPQNVFEGVYLTSGWGKEATGNLMENVYIINNQVIGNPYVAYGITAGYSDLAGGNAIKNVYLVGNSLKLSDTDSKITQGILIATGYWVNNAGNTISDIVVEDNTIEGYHDTTLMSVLSGTVGSKGNIIERMRISHNRFINLHPVLPDGAPIMALSLQTGDGATDYEDPSYQPVVYPDNNILRDVWVSNNTFSGQGGPAVAIGTGDPGAQHNELSNITILGNAIDGFFPGSGFNNGAISLYLGGKGDDRIQHVTIQQNTIKLVNQRTEFIGEEFFSGGIIMTAGNGTQNSFIQDVTAVGNKIDTAVPGIAIVGGFSRENMKATSGNTISQIRLWCNVIEQSPTMLRPYFPEAKGIILGGGYGPTNGNRVSDIQVKQNTVAGIEDDVTVVNNAGTGSIDNLVEYQDQ